jgi:sugar phosphate isomerase/epimerase
MDVTRRQLLGGLAAGATRLAAQQAKGSGPKPRSSPALCLHSDQLMKVGYDELGGFLHMMGFDGCQLAVRKGGHIPPEGDVNLHLERAIEAMTGSGVDVPVVSTDLTSPASEALRTVLGWGSQMGVPIFRPGDWKYQADIEGSLAAAQRDVATLAAFGRQVNMSIALHNPIGGFVGSAVWDWSGVLRTLDPRVGYDFDAGYAAAQLGIPGWLTAFRMALPRLKMVTARDCYWSKDGSAWKLTECPLGEGMVDWAQLFAALAQAKFTGPVVLHVGYQPQDELAAIKKDLAFLKKARDAAYA